MATRLPIHTWWEWIHLPVDSHMMGVNPLTCGFTHGVGVCCGWSCTLQEADSVCTWSDVLRTHIVVKPKPPFLALNDLIPPYLDWYGCGGVVVLSPTNVVACCGLKCTLQETNSDVHNPQVGGFTPSHVAMLLLLWDRTRGISVHWKVLKYLCLVAHSNK